MKRLLKSRLFFFILGIVLTASVVGVSASILYQADEIGFTPDDPNWNVNNLESALNDLYENGGVKPELLWTNPNPMTTFNSQTISLNLEQYKYVIIVVVTEAPSWDLLPRSTSIVPVGEYDSDIRLGATGTGGTRSNVMATTTGVSFGAGIMGTSTNNNKAIPYKIYGVKQDLGLDLGLE